MEMGLMSLRPSDSPVRGKSVSFDERSPPKLFEKDVVQKSPGRGILKKSSSTRAKKQFPVKIFKFRMLADYSLDICEDAPIYMAAVLEYLVTKVISLAGETANNTRKSQIKPSHLQIVFQNNEELRDLMIGEDGSIAANA